MSSPASPASVLPPAWTAVLDRIQQAVEQALAQVAEPEQAPLAPADRRARLEASLARLDEQTRQLQACVRRAEEQTADADTLIKTGTEAAQRWLEAIAVCRQRLAE